MGKNEKKNLALDQFVEAILTNIVFIKEVPKAQGITQFTRSSNPTVADVVKAITDNSIKNPLGVMISYHERILTVQDRNTLLIVLDLRALDDKGMEAYQLAYEQYLKNGSSNNSRLDTVFDKFSKWIKDIYSTISINNLGVIITPQSREVFNNIVGITKVNSINISNDISVVNIDNEKIINVEVEANVNQIKNFEVINEISLTATSKMNRILKILSGTILDFALFVSLYFIARLIKFFFANLLYHSDEDNVPYTFYSIWILLFFLIPYIILIKRGLKTEKFILILGIVYVGGGFCSLLTRTIIDSIPKINKIEVIKSNFIGIEGRDDIEYESNDGNAAISTKHTRSYVYIENDRRIEDEVSKLENEHTDGVSAEKFIFWQTALASGYNPKYIPNYNCCDLSSDKLELYFTVGPLVMIESFIESIKDALLILIVFIIYRMQNKHIFFENLESFKKYMKWNINKN